MPATCRRAAFFAVLLLAAGVCRAAEPQNPQDVDLQWGVRVPVRDGVELAATVYRPAGQKGPLPVIFTLTPYISDSYLDRALYFARHGYVFALVDVRGRGDSGGTFDPFAQEARDGYDVVEWLARQPWSNGKVAMWGGSYAGYDQWATAKERPPHLVTIVPAASAHAGVDFPFVKNIFYSYDMQWLTFTSGRAKNVSLFGEGSFWSQKSREMYLRHTPFRQLDRLVGNPSPVFQRWLTHPAVDGFWKAMDPTPEQLAAIDLPILTITGDYDGDQLGALAYYRDHLRAAPPAVRDRHYLIIGPWDHAGTRTPNRQVGGLTFGEASMLDLNALHKEWYDWTMKSGPRPAFLEKKVAYFVVGPGAENWKRADSLEEIGATRRTLYLGSDSSGSREGAGDAFHSGQLADAKPAASGTAAPDRYVYDPLDVRPGQDQDEESPGYILDQREALNLYGDGLVYHSQPFAAATEVSGQVKLSLWISLDVPDTDFRASLYEILPNGGSVLLTSDFLRARYRTSKETETLVPKGEILRYDFTGFPWFSRRVSRGSRLRLVVTCPNSPDLEKNYNSGGVVADETAKDARTAHVAVYHDAAHPSALEIPIVP
ncbi:MAG TPA: CocE/NonD family hydrolase [Thermoanaerobaculia bacterium]|jgi:putative CocE/NonD family hydrolase